jgi:hypothetical protein
MACIVGAKWMMEETERVLHPINVVGYHHSSHGRCAELELCVQPISPYFEWCDGIGFHRKPHLVMTCMVNAGGMM